MIRNCLHSLGSLIASFISSIDGYVSFNAMLLVERWLEKYVEDLIGSTGGGDAF